MTDSLVWLLKRVLIVMKQELQKLIDALSGKDRREKWRLRRQLAALQTEYNLLQGSLSEHQRIAKLEIRGLEALKQEVENERDDLQLQVWELEQQVEELLKYIEQVEHGNRVQVLNAATPEICQEPPNIDLSVICLGLVGGHPAT